MLSEMMFVFYSCEQGIYNTLTLKEVLPTAITMINHYIKYGYIPDRLLVGICKQEDIGKVIDNFNKVINSQ